MVHKGWVPAPSRNDLPLNTTVLTGTLREWVPNCTEGGESSTTTELPVSTTVLWYTRGGSQSTNDLPVSTTVVVLS